MSLDLDAIEAAEKAMTEAPWRVDCCEGGSAVSASSGVPITSWRRGVSDSAGIALLRNAAPAMTRRIREQDAELARWKDQWSVMARACGNWRTWPGEAEDDHDHSDWLAASRAIIERDELIAEIERLRALCGEADITIGELDHRGDYLEERARLRAASKGEQ